MSELVKTALLTAFRELRNKGESETSQMDEWVRTQSYWEEEVIAAHNVTASKIPPADAGIISAISVLVEVREGKRLSHDDRAIVDRILGPVLNSSDFTNDLANFIDQLQAGKIPSSGLSLAN